MTTTSGGNISVRDNEGDIWVTPSAVDKGSLISSDIVHVRKDGRLEGRHKPSLEFPFHKAIYEARPDIRAVIHAHPAALVAFSIVHEIPDTNIIGQAKFICGPIGYARYELPGSEMLGKRIAAEFGKGFNAIIMENHGAVIGGYDLADAFQRFETLEFCAQTLLYANTIGVPKYLTNREIEDSEAHVPGMFPEMENIEHPTEEKKIRIEMCRIVHRACEQGLMISSYGTVSMRWRGNDFLITPTNVPRWDMQPDDIVQIRNGMREPGKIPSRATWLHQEIYMRNRKINSILFTQSPCLMAFGVTHAPLDVRTIPESWILLQDIPFLPFGIHNLPKNKISDLLAGDNPAVMIQNDALLVTGDQLLQTFDRLEVAEFSARSLIMAKPIGKLVPINDHQVRELKKAFLKE